MNTRDLMEARLKEQRGEVRTLPTPPKTLGADVNSDVEPEDAADASETLETLCERQLKRLLRKASDPREKLAAVTTAVKYLAVKFRVGPVFGGAFEEEDE